MIGWKAFQLNSNDKERERVEGPRERRREGRSATHMEPWGIVCTNWRREWPTRGATE